jgi:hypothetical protein
MEPLRSRRHNVAKTKGVQEGKVYNAKLKKRTRTGAALHSALISVRRESRSTQQMAPVAGGGAVGCHRTEDTCSADAESGREGGRDGVDVTPPTVDV